MNAVGDVDGEIEAAAQELRRSGQVLVCWHRRRGGGQVSAGTALVLLPGPREPVAVTDGELASLRCLELGGELQVAWPSNPMIGRHAGAEPPTPPLAPEIEAAALAMRRRADARAPDPGQASAAGS